MKINTSNKKWQLPQVWQLAKHQALSLDGTAPKRNLALRIDLAE